MYVTGTFDNWEKTEQLEKKGDIFEKKVKLPVATEKIYYKFVVDGEWITDHEAPQEPDPRGNVNNYLLPKDMSKLEDTDPASAILSSAAPESTTAQLAGAVPLENKPVETKEENKEDVKVEAPGGYPETPLADLNKEIKVDPLPATNGAVNPIDLAPGDKIPDELKAGSITDNVTLDKESYEKSDRLPGLDDPLGSLAPVVDVGKIVPDAATEDNKEFSVNPLPATEGALNPPDGVTAGGVTDHVTLDKESYEKSDRLPGLDALGSLAPVVDVGKILPEDSTNEEKKEFSVNPLPATEGAVNPPGGVATGSITDNVTLDKESYEQSDRIPGITDLLKDLPPVNNGKIIPESSLSMIGADNTEFKVNPLPATEGALNPTDGVATGSITDHVTLDKESYEKSDRIPGLDTELPPVVGGTIIPESSLPMIIPGEAFDSAFINSVAPESTTADLVGQVPLEKNKKEEDATISSAAPESTTAALAGQVPLEKKEGATISTVTPAATTVGLAGSVPLLAGDVAINTVTPESTTAVLAGQVPVEPKVPEMVKQSQEKAHVEPEASAIPEQVKEKAAVEEELLEKAAEVPATAEGTAGVGTERRESDKSLTENIKAAALTAGAVAVSAGAAAGVAAVHLGNSVATAAKDAADKLPAFAQEVVSPSEREAPFEVTPAETPAEVAPEVPVEVKESIEAAGVGPEAAANPEAVEEKKEVEAELLSQLKSVKAPQEEAAPQVPEEVKESIKESGKSPEAAANPLAVEEKKDVEAQLLKEVKPVESAPEIAPAVPTEVKDSIIAAGETPEAASNPVAVEEKKETEAQLLKEVKPAETVPAPVAAVPEPVKDSIIAAGETSEAAANAAAVEEKKETEAQLLKEVKPVETGELSTKAEEPEVETQTVRKVESKTEEPKTEAKVEEPAAAPPANGTKSASTPVPASTSTEAAPAAKTDAAADKEKKKKHRISGFFTKIKNKLKN